MKSRITINKLEDGVISYDCKCGESFLESATAKAHTCKRNSKLDGSETTGSTADHTPTPWTYSGTGNFVGGADGQRVADVYRDNLSADERMANAAFIVRAVNSHQYLVDTIQILRDRLAKSLGLKANAEINLADRAIAKAEGGK